MIIQKHLEVYGNTTKMKQMITLYVGRASPKDIKNNDVTYFDSFGIEHIPKKSEAFVGNKNKYF